MEIEATRMIEDEKHDTPMYSQAKIRFLVNYRLDYRLVVAHNYFNLIFVFSPAVSYLYILTQTVTLTRI